VARVTMRRRPSGDSSRLNPTSRRALNVAPPALLRFAAWPPAHSSEQARRWPSVGAPHVAQRRVTAPRPDPTRLARAPPADARREWELMLSELRRLRDEHGWRYLAEASGLSGRELRYVLIGGKLPHLAARTRLLALVTSAGLGQTGLRHEDRTAALRTPGRQHCGPETVDHGREVAR
jgi:hypothetical protein